jgi:hypothetical protein
MLKRVKHVVFGSKMVKRVYLFIKRVKRIMSSHSLVVSGLNGLTYLIKQVVFGLTHNGLANQADQPKPNSLT